jgi:hypothetical protein
MVRAVANPFRGPRRRHGPFAGSDEAALVGRPGLVPQVTDAVNVPEVAAEGAVLLSGRLRDRG